MRLKVWQSDANRMTSNRCSIMFANIAYFACISAKANHKILNFYLRRADISTRARWRCTSRQLIGYCSVGVNFFTRKSKDSKTGTGEFSFSWLFWARINSTHCLHNGIDSAVIIRASNGLGQNQSNPVHGPNFFGNKPWVGLDRSLLATDAHGPVKKIGVFRVQVVGKHCTKFILL
jgi:hypothetical protein